MRYVGNDDADDDCPTSLHGFGVRIPPRGRRGSAVAAACNQRRRRPAGRKCPRADDAFALLYDRHGALVFGIAKRVLGNREQAEDVTQSVFLQIWTRPEMFAGGNFAAWVARVARNASLDVLRSAAVRTRAPELALDVPAEGNLDEFVFERVRSSALSAAVAALPDDQRVAIEQAYFAGLSYREVAERLNEPLGTIKSRIRMGLRKLVESMQQVVLT